MKPCKNIPLHEVFDKEVQDVITSKRHCYLKRYTAQHLRLVLIERNGTSRHPYLNNRTLNKLQEFQFAVIVPFWTEHLLLILCMERAANKIQ